MKWWVVSLMLALSACGVKGGLKTPAQVEKDTAKKEATAAKKKAQAEKLERKKQEQEEAQ